jgi:hypothetical protein
MSVLDARSAHPIHDAYVRALVHNHYFSQSNMCARASNLGESAHIFQKVHLCPSWTPAAHTQYMMLM